MTALVEVKQLVKRYDGLGGGVTALKGIDLALNAGEFIAVAGRSGSGKTTLINMMTALDRISSGEVWV
jgi:putative ABC transport system ATP-binding protein